jgi:hypothetical protein
MSILDASGLMMSRRRTQMFQIEILSSDTYGHETKAK